MLHENKAIFIYLKNEVFTPNLLFSPVDLKNFDVSFFSQTNCSNLKHNLAIYPQLVTKKAKQQPCFFNLDCHQQLTSQLNDLIEVIIIHRYGWIDLHKWNHIMCKAGFVALIIGNLYFFTRAAA